jgi:HlyD family secretion protein
MDAKMALRSDDIQDVIGHPPSWLLRWGVTIVFVFFFSLLLMSWAIKYPDIITANVTVTTVPAPVILVSRTSGQIILVKKNNSLLKKGEIFAYFKSNANYQDILYLDKLVGNFQVSDLNSYLKLLDINLEVGDVQPYLNQLIVSLQDYVLFNENGRYQKQMKFYHERIKSHSRMATNLDAQLKIMKEEVHLAEVEYQADSILFTQRVMAILDLNKVKVDYLTKKRVVRNIESSIIDNEIQIETVKNNLVELEIEYNNKKRNLLTALTNSSRLLDAQLESWKEKYLFIAPSKSILAYLGFLENELFVETGKPLFSFILPSKRLIAKAELPTVGAGKVKIGQLVNIRLIDFPYEQFGSLRGKVIQVSKVSEKKLSYAVFISLSDGTKTTYNKNIELKSELTGEAQIITEDLNMLERIFHQFRKIVNKR